MRKTQPAESSGKPSVAQVVETMSMGGAENLAVRIANALPAAGFTSHLIVITGPGVLSSRIDPAVKVHYLNYQRASVRNPLVFPFSILNGLGRLSGVIRREKIGLVQTHLPGANFWGLLLAMRGVCRVLATVHNNREFDYGDVDSPLRSRFRRSAYRAIVKRCVRTIAVSEEVKLSLIRDLGLDTDAADRISVVTNGVSVPDPLDAEAKLNVRRGLGIDPNLPFILAAGRFGPQKNFADLIQVATILKEKGTPFQLVIGGEGEFLEDLRARVQELGLNGSVFLPGNLQNLGQVMLAADVFVMTSLWEGLPLVLLEAMAAGLPAVAYAIAGVNELVVEGQTGRLVLIGDTTAFAASLDQVLNNQVTWGEMGQLARKRVQADFNFDTLLNDLALLYREPLQ